MIRTDREYRNIPMNLEIRDAQEGEGDSYKVHGYASTFEPYVLWDDGETKIFERIMPDAFDKADMSDVIFLVNHEGIPHARNKNKTMQLSVDEHGLMVDADLSLTKASRDAFEAIKAGLLDQMSFAFTVAEDGFDRDTKTRIIHRVAKVYDVSAVNIPANPGTDIAAVSARSYVDGVIDAVKTAERLEREKALELAKAKYKYMEVEND